MKVIQIATLAMVLFSAFFLHQYTLWSDLK